MTFPRWTVHLNKATSTSTEKKNAFQIQQIRGKHTDLTGNCQMINTWHKLQSSFQTIYLVLELNTQHSWGIVHMCPVDATQHICQLTSNTELKCTWLNVIEIFLWVKLKLAASILKKSRLLLYYGKQVLGESHSSHFRLQHSQKRFLENLEGAIWKSLTSDRRRRTINNFCRIWDDTGAWKTMSYETYIHTWLRAAAGAGGRGGGL